MKQPKEGNWFKRHKVLTVILGLFLLVVIVNAAGGDTDTSNSASTGEKSETKKQETTQAVKIGEAARDGKFEFTVKSIDCGKPSVTDSTGYVTQTAQGQYCLLTLAVKNIGDQQQAFLESDQKLLNSDGQQFSPDTTAGLTLANNGNIWLAQINPGNSVEGVLVFDLPVDQTPVVAQLHDSAFSNGIKVNLQ